MSYSFLYITELFLLIIVCAAITIIAYKYYNKIIAMFVPLVFILVIFQSQASRRISPTYTSQKIPAGSGWSFFLNKKRLNGTPIYAKEGIIKNNVWGGGTKIKDIQKHLIKNGKTLSAYPSIENGTLGAWIASGSHGSGGTLWKPNFGNIVVEDLVGNKGTFTTTPDSLFAKGIPIKECRRYLIKEIEITPQDNLMCERKIYKLNSPSEYESFIKGPNYLRLLIAAKRGVVCVEWVPTSISKATEPYLNSHNSLYRKVDLMSFVETTYTAIDIKPQFMTLSDACLFTVEPEWYTTPFGLLYNNFEIFVMKYESNSQNIYDVSEKLVEFFQTHNGRCEIRLGKDILYLDLNLHINTNPSVVFELLYPLLSEYKVLLHRGKFQTPVDPFTIFEL